MNDRIRKLIIQIEALKRERELQTALRQQEQELRYRVEDTRIEFEARLRSAHLELKEGLLQWLAASQPRNVLSAPIIYAMVVPIFLLDMALTLYQHSCFRLYRIPRVRRRDYLVLDRHNLAYLNAIQKFNCLYCGYGNGVIAYAREITARTEQYWCPIKHAHEVLDPHDRYLYFVPFGDAEAFRLGQQGYREALIRSDIPYNEPTHEVPPSP